MTSGCKDTLPTMHGDIEHIVLKLRFRRKTSSRGGAGAARRRLSLVSMYSTSIDYGNATELQPAHRKARRVARGSVQQDKL